MEQKYFLYIDILGFSTLVKSNSPKIDQIFKILNSLKAHKHFAFKTIVFSDTILVFNEDSSREDEYYMMYLCEFVQDLFYSTNHLNVYFRAVLNRGEFIYRKLSNIESYYGKALIDCYEKEKEIKSIGLFVDKTISKKIITFTVIDFDKNFDFVILNQAFDELDQISGGKLPIEYEDLLETDIASRIDEDLFFLREIEYLKNNHPDEDVKLKYENTYNLLKNKYMNLFNIFEEQGFLPMTINSSYAGHYNPFELLSEKEFKCENRKSPQPRNNE